MNMGQRTKIIILAVPPLVQTILTNHLSSCANTHKRYLGRPRLSLLNLLFGQQLRNVFETSSITVLAPTDCSLHTFKALLVSIKAFLILPAHYSIRKKD